jgi:hypothetical protein
MLTPEESAHLLNLPAPTKAARRKSHGATPRNHARLAELQTEIDELTENCDEVLEIADTN